MMIEIRIYHGSGLSRFWLDRFFSRPWSPHCVGWLRNNFPLNDAGHVHAGQAEGRVGGHRDRAGGGRCAGAAEEARGAGTPRRATVGATDGEAARASRASDHCELYVDMQM